MRPFRRHGSPSAGLQGAHPPKSLARDLPGPFLVQDIGCGSPFVVVKMAEQVRPCATGGLGVLQCAAASQGHEHGDSGGLTPLS